MRWKMGWKYQLISTSVGGIIGVISGGFFHPFSHPTPYSISGFLGTLLIFAVVGRMIRLKMRTSKHGT